MQFIVSSSILLKNLQQISGVVGSNTVLPILQDFLFEINNQKLVVSATDLESMLKVEVEIESKGKKKFCVPARMLLDTLKTIPNQPLSFSLDENLSLEITSDNGKYKIPCENSDNFPKEPPSSETKSFQIDADVLTKGINKAIIAVSNDDIRPAMNGVYIEFNENEFNFVSTDSHRLVVYTRTDVKCKESNGFIVQRKSLQLIKNAFESSDEMLTLNYNQSHLFIQSKTLKMSSRLIDAKFPDYKVVIPSENPYKLILNKNDFLQALRRLSIYSNKSTHLVVLKVAGGELNMIAHDDDLNFEGNERMACKYDGDDMKLSYNAQSLIELLGAVDAEEILFELADFTKASLLKQTQQEANENLLILVMPFMVNE